ncbi:hypothetical protein, partial [Serratia marcescens]|uniref:hypothetical protein n=1 Tax=Serratia marcescens TaxID=615 RepID=UPI002812F10A
SAHAPAITLKTAKQPSVHVEDRKDETDHDGSWCGESSDESFDEEASTVKGVKRAAAKPMKATIMKPDQAAEYGELMRDLRSTKLEM